MRRRLHRKPAAQPGPKTMREAFEAASKGPPPENIEDDNAIGQWLFDRLKSECGFETDPALIACAESAAAKMLKEIPQGSQRQVVVLRASDINAFAVPGRYVYLCSGLVRALSSEDAVALVIGHELGHAELGHVDFFKRLEMWKDLPAGQALSVLLLLFQRFAFSPERERAADAYGMRLCLRAGYDGAKCLELFDTLEDTLRTSNSQIKETLIHGPEAARRSTHNEFERMQNRLEVWTFERITGYPSVQERRSALQACVTNHQFDSRLVETGELLERLAQPDPKLTARLEPVDLAIDQWNADMALVAANLGVVMRLPAYRYFKDRDTECDPLTGETAQRVSPAIHRLKQMFAHVHLLIAMLEQVERERGELDLYNPQEEVLRGLERLLIGRAVPEKKGASVLDRLKPRSPNRETIVTPRKLLNSMSAALETMREPLEDLSEVLELWEPLLETSRRELLLIARMAELLGIDGGPDLAPAQEMVRDLHRLFETDPLALDADSQSELSTQTERLKARMGSEMNKRQAVGEGLKRAVALRARMFETAAKRLRRDNGPDEGELARDIQPQLSGSETLKDLERWLDLLQAAWNEGRWQTAGNGLERWLAAAQTLLDTEM